jgi:hypothetical protein
MDTKELLVHERSQWQTVEGLHARVIHALGVLNFTFLLKCEILRQMAASKQKERGGVDQLQCPQVNNTLEKEEKRPQGQGQLYYK